MSGALKHQALLQKLRLELGVTVLEALDNPEVLEIMLNPDGQLWIECFGQPMQVAGSMSALQAESLMGTIAFALHTEVTRERPILEGELPLDGVRFAGQLPPVVAAPSFTIRKPASRIITLSEYVGQGVMKAEEQALILQAVQERRNILVVGGTGSGKTTLTNAIIAAIAEQCPSDRLVIIEDTAEIQCLAANNVLLHTTQQVTMQDCLKTALRMRPDRILVGEVRDKAALDLLKAWNTGHPGGVATLHANDARGSLTRLESLVAESRLVMGNYASALIGEAVDVVVVIRKCQAGAVGRRVTEVLAVQGWDKSGYKVDSS